MRKTLAGLWLLSLALVTTPPTTAQEASPGAEATVGDFSASLLLTRQPEDFVAAWSQPAREGSAPRIDLADHAYRGESIVSFVLFNSCRASETGACNATVDYLALAPDGSEYARFDGVPLWEGPPPPEGRTQLARSNLGVEIEETDPIGEYVVQAHVCDGVRDACVDLEARFTVREMPERVDGVRLIMGYYLEPRPVLIGAVIRDLEVRQAFGRPAARRSFSAFFTGVFHRHPEWLEAWRAVIAERDETTRGALEAAMGQVGQFEALSESEENSPEFIDVLWSAFFASGARRYVDAVVRRLDHLDEREDLQLFLTAASARWSLSANARQHERVARILAEEVERGAPTRRAAIRDLLETEPKVLQERTMEEIRAQRAAGVW